MICLPGSNIHALASQRIRELVDTVVREYAISRNDAYAVVGRWIGLHYATVYRLYHHRGNYKSAMVTQTLIELVAGLRPAGQIDLVVREKPFRTRKKSVR